MATVVPEVGFHNVGNSCFINASVQAIFAIPEFVQQVAHQASEREEQLLVVLGSMQQALERRLPEPLLARFYHGRQEDAAEFSVLMLEDCPSLQPALAGKEVPQVLCQHCGCGRSMAPDTFQNLHLALLYEAPIYSVKEALDRYLKQKHLADGFTDWRCEQAGCVASGVQADVPYWTTKITTWPRVLMLTLKRWDFPHRRALAHRVSCDATLAIGGRTYRLQSLVAHIGETADSGHYVAYRRHGDGILKCNDNTMTFLPDFILPPEEKAYVLYYVAQDRGEHGELPPGGPGICLDVSSDSDVIVQMDPPAAGNLKRASSATDDSSSKRRASKPSGEVFDEAVETFEVTQSRVPAATTSAPPSAQRPRPLSRFTAQEQEKIVSICKQHNTVKKVVAELAVLVPNLTTRDPKADGYVSSFTIRHWIQDHERLDKALQLASRTRKTETSKRAPPSNSARANFADSVHEAIAACLEKAENEEDFVAALQQAVPDFSDSNAKASNYIPRTTLKRWFRVTGQDIFETPAPQTWESEFEKTFCITFPRPGMRCIAVDPDDEVDQWVVRGSWTFCPQCGRRRPRSNVGSLRVQRPDKRCQPRCDPAPEDLLLPRPDCDSEKHCKLEAYIMPNSQHWENLLADLALTGLPLTPGISKKDLDTLAVLDLKIDYQTRRGGNAEITSKQKKSVIRGRWKSMPLFEIQRSDQASRLFAWLLANNDTYAGWVQFHKQLANDNDNSKGPWQEVHTATLLLNSPGIEIAARPWLYPLASFGDTDLSPRLSPLKWIAPNSLPSLRASVLRKLTSRCIDYSRDFALKSLLYDTAMARTITSLITVANQRNIAPEFAAQQQDMFEGYWLLQLRKMEDVCRREYEDTGDFGQTFPNIFFTVAPAEWRYLLPEGLTMDDALSEQQDLITLHMHHTLRVVLEQQLISHSDNLHAVGIANIRHWSFRFEFQARGTIHLHAVLWTDLRPEWSADNITARTGEAASPFLRLLEKLFKSRADVQCGDGTHCLMQYVAGYLLKASDALQFLSKQVADQDTQWRQAYRLLCKRSPTEQELVMEFAGLSMVKHSFSGCDLFAPIPGSAANNNSRRQYDAYQHHLKQPESNFGNARGMTFIQWLRMYQVSSDNRGYTTVQLRNQHGPAKGKACGVAMSFPFELLDIYLGAWAACSLPGMLEERLLPVVPHTLKVPGFEDELARRRSFTAPCMCHHLKAVLSLNEFQLDGADPQVYSPNLQRFFARVEPELMLRGINSDRISTFKAKIQATNLLLLRIRDGLEDAGFWTARDLPGYPRRQWSPEQSAVMDWMRDRLGVNDANDSRNRVLQISGPPGTGKTEVVIGATKLALDDDCRVLVAGPIGLLVAMYRLKLPADERLTMETIHSAFKITRPADAAYIPPGRLRRYDVIIFDEVSQIDAAVWADLKAALGELHPGPLVLFVGDFQQLQPVTGKPQLQIDLDTEVANGTVDRIDLKNHNLARSIDPDMLEFLTTVRETQPTRAQLEDFFTGRVWNKQLSEIAEKARTWENATNKNFMFLTLTNKGSADINRARLAAEFPQEAQLLLDGAGIPAETGRVILSSGMRVRLTYNVNKQDGFVNGNTGTVRLVLRRDVFVMQSAQATSVLVYPINLRGRKFLPVAYGYATTMRRAQGATLDGVGLCFDRRLPDRGYAYVGLSRAKVRTSVFHVGRLRQTDWLPVGTPKDDEHTRCSALSESTDNEQEESSEMISRSSEASSGDFDPSSSDFEFYCSDFDPSSSDFEFF